MARCGEIWGTFAEKFSDQFLQSVFGEDNLAFLAYYLKQQQKVIAYALPTVVAGRCGKMWDKVGRCGNRLPIKPYEPV